MATFVVNPKILTPNQEDPEPLQRRSLIDIFQGNEEDTSIVAKQQEAVENPKWTTEQAFAELKKLLKKNDSRVSDAFLEAIAMSPDIDEIIKRIKDIVQPAPVTSQKKPEPLERQDLTEIFKANHTKEQKEGTPPASNDGKSEGMERRDLTAELRKNACRTSRNA